MMRKRVFNRWLRRGVLLGGLALALNGCTKPSDSGKTAAPLEEIPIALATPADAARTALLGLRAELRALARRDEKAVDHWRDTLRSQVVARDELWQRAQKLGYRPPRLDEQLSQKASEARLSPEEKLAAGFIENWISILNFYAEGLRWEPSRTVLLLATPPNEGHALVQVPAGGPAGEAAVIQIECVRKGPNWQVVSIGFVTDFAASQPASAPVPASPPASAPAP